ncbi:nucleotide sugar dehydrogenase [Prochlorococcus sp. AH-716-D22]|nr:nucleotide sugar dehydrogenase [Prochlorococcus sp. AH-716-D22]
MKIGVIGLGKLGCSMFAAFAASGNNVVGFDLNKDSRIKLINKIQPVFETGLQKELEIGFNNYQIVDNTLEVIKKSDVIYIVVPTPSLNDGTFDTSYLENVIKDIIHIDFCCKNKLLVITSTVLPGDTRLKLISSVRNAKGMISNINFCYSPEFIALGSVLSDFKNPDFLLVGEEMPNSAQKHIEAMMTVIKNKNIPIRRMSIESAEMSKISINSYITSKISFANAIGLASDSIQNCSSKDVLSAIGSDSRIGSKYLSKGLGFGGPCFPRDNRAIQQVINRTSGLDYKLPIDNEKFNSKLPTYYMKKITKICLEREILSVVIVGLTYKDGSYLLVESQAYDIALKLKKELKVFYFDPDVIYPESVKEIEIFGLKSKVDGDILLLNCSRDKEKSLMAKNIIKQKKLNFFEFQIWE